MTKEDRSLKSYNDEALKKGDGEVPRKAWQPMKVTHVGKAKDVVRGGGGKLSVETNDTGDIRKPPGQG